MEAYIAIAIPYKPHYKSYKTMATRKNVKPEERGNQEKGDTYQTNSVPLKLEP